MKNLNSNYSIFIQVRQLIHAMVNKKSMKSVKNELLNV